MASEGVSSKPWQLLCGVEPVHAQKSRIEVWESLLRFQRRQKFASGAGPSWRTSARAVQKENVGLEAPQRVSAGALPSGAVRSGPPSTRPQNGRSTNSMNYAPGKVADTQCQPMKAARKGAVPCRATGLELPKALGAYLLYQRAINVRHGVKGDRFGTLKFNGCPIGFQTCMGPVIPLFWPISPIWNGCIYPRPVPHCIKEVTNLLLTLQAHR
uniref:Uncharacterized protein n=1 Tax=Macaca fascicularis TaxID=9541 RepID=A0A7N9CY09_MACFA